MLSLPPGRDISDTERAQVSRSRNSTTDEASPISSAPPTRLPASGRHFKRAFHSDDASHLTVRSFVSIVVVATIAFMCALCVFPASAKLWGRTLGKAPAVTSMELDGLEETSDGAFRAISDAPSIVLSFSEPFDLDTVGIYLVDEGNSSASIWDELGFRAGAMLDVTVTSRTTGTEDYAYPVSQRLLSADPSSEVVVMPETRKGVDSVRLDFPNVTEGETIVLTQAIEANQPVPVVIHWPLVIFLTILGLLVVCALPVSIPSRTRWLDHAAMRRATATAVAIFLALVSIASSYVTGPQEDVTINDAFAAYNDPNQYQHVANSMLEGHAWIDEEVPSWLAEAENPYDFDLRKSKSLESCEPYLFDYAFFDGRYYSYDGILPVLVLFLPYRAITGTDLSNSAATSALSVMATIAAICLANALLDRFRRDASVSEHVFGMLAMWLCTCVMWLAFYPTVYHEVILSGITAAQGGIALWLSADGNGRQPLGRGRLFLGSLLVGATVLARPALVLCSLIALALYWDRFFGRPSEEREFFGTSRAAVLNTALVILAMGIVAMAWNYARFGNPLDFGYKYNLTGFDMVHKPSSATRTLFGVGMYFLTPAIVGSSFPFFKPNNLWFVVQPYASLTGSIPGIIIEPYYGGVLAFFPYIVLGTLLILSPRARASLRKYHGSKLPLLLVLLTVAIATVDSTVAVTQRYQADFTWLLCSCALVSYCSWANARQEAGRRFRLMLLPLMGLLCLSCALCFANLFATDRYATLTLTNPSVWWSVRTWFLAFA